MCTHDRSIKTNAGEVPECMASFFKLQQHWTDVCYDWKAACIIEHLFICLIHVYINNLSLGINQTQFSLNHLNSLHVTAYVMSFWHRVVCSGYITNKYCFWEGSENQIALKSVIKDNFTHLIDFTFRDGVAMNFSIVHTVWLMLLNLIIRLDTVQFK